MNLGMTRGGYRGATIEDAGAHNTRIVLRAIRAQGMLTNKYLKGIPTGSRASQGKSLDPGVLTDHAVASLNKLNDLAASRGQTLAQMALAWVLRDGGITSALIGASKPEQVIDCVGALANLSFTAAELAEIDRISLERDINLWAKSSAD